MLTISQSETTPQRRWYWERPPTICNLEATRENKHMSTKSKVIFAWSELKRTCKMIDVMGGQSGESWEQKPISQTVVRKRNLMPVVCFQLVTTDLYSKSVKLSQQHLIWCETNMTLLWNSASPRHLVYCLVLGFLHDMVCPIKSPFYPS